MFSFLSLRHFNKQVATSTRKGKHTPRHLVLTMTYKSQIQNPSTESISRSATLNNSSQRDKRAIFTTHKIRKGPWLLTCPDFFWGGEGGGRTIDVTVASTVQEHVQRLAHGPKNGGYEPLARTHSSARGERLVKRPPVVSCSWLLF